MSGERQRVLVLAGRDDPEHAAVRALSQHFRVDVFEHIDAAMKALRRETYHAIFADVGDFLPLERELVGEKASLVLNTIGEGVCIVDADGRQSWCNQRMRSFSGEVIEHVRRICTQALSIFRTQSGPIHPERSGSVPRSRKFTFQAGASYYEMICSPILEASGDAGKDTEPKNLERDGVHQVVGVVWDATSGKRLQGKIDAIDAAGRELARIDSEAVARLAPSDRLKLLQDKIVRYSKDLMHFDHFAIRLLDRRANKLEVVITEGLPPEALEIDLYAQPEGNGISGYVAATGRSYICHDTEKDPRYVLGLQHSKSSLTVPLMLYDEVVGIYNVESETVGAFNEDDRQFAEIFGRYVALALNILDLLVVERYTTSGQITDSVVQEMAQPLNDIVTEAQTLLEQYIDQDAMRGHLHRIVDQVEMIRHAICDVAAGPTTVIGSDAHESEPTDPLLCDRHVLIADDQANIRRTICEVLRKHGCRVQAAKDGYEACTLLEGSTQQGKQAFDLVVCDIKMPYRNGYEIFAVAQRVRPGLPVMLMTGFGYDPNHSIVRATQEGLAAVLFKPFKVDQLLEEVRKALREAAEKSTASSA